MGEFSIYHWLIVLVVVILLFGSRRIPALMRGLGQGVRSFKQELRGIDSASEKKAPKEH